MLTLPPQWTPRYKRGDFVFTFAAPHLLKDAISTSQTYKIINIRPANRTIALSQTYNTIIENPFYYLLEDTATTPPTTFWVAEDKIRLPSLPKGSVITIDDGSAEVLFATMFRGTRLSNSRDWFQYRIRPLGWSGQFGERYANDRTGILRIGGQDDGGTG